jgi:hypothetical protein
MNGGGASSPSRGDRARDNVPHVLAVVRALDDAHCIAIWGRTLIQIWRGVATGEASTQMNRLASQLIAADPFPATSLFLVEASSPPPEQETRLQFAKFSRESVSKMSLAVIVAEGGGFRSALVRAVGVTLTTLSPHRSQFRFVNDLETALKMLEPHLQPNIGGGAELGRVVADLRSKIEAKQQVAVKGR